MTLYHYTCDHGHRAIGEAGELLPGAARDPEGAAYWTAHFVWLTDLRTPDRDALGLTSHMLRCDRTAHRYRVTSESDVLPWWRVARTLPRGYREVLETAPGVRPMHWFVSERGVPVIHDPVDRGDK